MGNHRKLKQSPICLAYFTLCNYFMIYSCSGIYSVFFFIEEYHFIVWMDQGLFTHLPVKEQDLSCFQFGTLPNQAAMKVCVCLSADTHAPFSWVNTSLGNSWIIQHSCIYLLRSCHLPIFQSVSFYIPTHNERKFQFSNMWKIVIEPVWTLSSPTSHGLGLLSFIIFLLRVIFYCFFACLKHFYWKTV